MHNRTHTTFMFICFNISCFHISTKCYAAIFFIECFVYAIRNESRTVEKIPYVHTYTQKYMYLLLSSICLAIVFPCNVDTAHCNV
jgi:hypothetical protein